MNEYLFGFDSVWHICKWLKRNYSGPIRTVRHIRLRLDECIWHLFASTIAFVFTQVIGFGEVLGCIPMLNLSVQCQLHAGDKTKTVADLSYCVDSIDSTR